MIVILSPSKTMDMTGSVELPHNNFSEKTMFLLEKLKTFSPEDLSKTMKVKGKTLESVVDIYANFHTSGYKKAIEAYTGAVFKGMKVKEYSQEERTFLDEHFIVLSALYGVLPADSLVREYRLDMTVKVLEEETLYAYWKEEVNNTLTELMKAKGENLLINLASTEFSKLIDRKTFPYEIIDIDFKEERDGKFKAVSTYAKKARGVMGRYIVKNKISQGKDLKEFKEEGYSFNQELSTDKKYIFTR
ncbi:UPF0246 protein [Propionigenium maris DSM 9537]|uniref:UPF0246 protein PM10SUCC1_29490 n=1 Tax=Propionigenium maris DSM 9537 TaxID=1123000 RepID=A0A9W6GNY0_9FUSO|nr:YaaA family protein [Propionigenium maris]GLI57435.1 UPF0246 protein [Propionigenium maris DSM 9537]